MPETLQFNSLIKLLNHPEFVEGKFWYRKSYDANQLVLLEGETGNDVFVILKGKVAICIDVSVSEDRHILSGISELSEGDEFALSSLFGDEPHCASVKTVSSCQFAVIEAAKLKQFLDDHISIGYLLLFHWMKLILPRLRQSNQRFSHLFSWGLKVHQIDSVI